MTQWTSEAPEWQPDEQLLHMLHDAVRRGDTETYLDTLLNTSVVMPVDHPTSDDWAVASLDAGTWVVVFSSVDALQAVPDGATQQFLVWPVIDLLHAWPDPSWTLLVDGSLPTEATVASDAIAGLVRRATAAFPLDAALRAADGLPSYLEALRRAEVVVPIWPAGSPSRDLAHPDFAWWRTESDGAEPVVMLFSSPVRLQARLGDVPWIAASFVDLLAHWPSGCAAHIDLGHRIGRRLSADTVAAMANWPVGRHRSGGAA